MLTAFAEFTGVIDPPADSASVSVEAGIQHFTPGKKGQILLNIRANADGGSSLDPGQIQVSNATVLGANTNLSGSNSSATVVRVSNPSLQITLFEQGETSGAFRLLVSLAGDVNNDFAVTKTDLTAIKQLFGTTVNASSPSLAADLNLDGIINKTDLKLAKQNLKASTDLRVQPVDANPLDSILPAGALSLVGLSETTLNALSTPVSFHLQGTTFLPDLAETHLSINGVEVDSADVVLASNDISANNVLVDGRNDISLATVDNIGRPLFFNVTVWAGGNTLTVNIQDSAGNAITDPAEIVLSLGDDPGVTFQATVSTGILTIENVPSRTVLIQGTASGNRSGVAGAVGNEGSVILVLAGLSTPSTVDNNDLSLGTDGWDVGTSPVTIVPHQEVFGASSVAAQGLLVAAAAAVDNDIVVSTSGEGEQSISRTFETQAGTTSVRVRYRFVTSEVPGGYFGTQFNDYYRVSIRSQAGGGANDANNMNALGLGAFDANGATQWRELKLKVNAEGDTVQVDAVVANVADGFLDSQVIVDFIEEEKQKITPHLAWNTTTGGLDLTYTVEGEENVSEATNIDVYWANGTQFGNRLGAAFSTFTVPAGTTPGQHTATHIEGSLLVTAAAGTTHILAASSEDDVFALQDVSVGFGAQANAAVVSQASLDLIKGALRFAGQSTASINSTARTPEDQARAMFQNLVHPGETAAQILQNINVQHNGDGGSFHGYAAAGDAVINTFAGLTAGQNAASVLANSAAIQAAMVAEINSQGADHVSRHCADPAVTNVLDIGSGAFSTSAANRFIQQVQASGAGYIDERASNGCFHLEIAQ